MVTIIVNKDISMQLIKVCEKINNVYLFIFSLKDGSIYLF